MSITVKGTVREGNKIGRKLGFPTANIELDPLIAITEGVYAVEINLDGHIYSGVANVGVHPTINEVKSPIIEVNIFEYNGSLYGKEISVELRHYIREEQKFENCQLLAEAIAEDIKIAKEYFINR